MIILYIKVTILVCLILLITYIISNKIEKVKIEKENKKQMEFENYLKFSVNNIDDLVLVGLGVGNDSDYKFSKAVNKIVLSNNIKVKIYN